MKKFDQNWSQFTDHEDFGELYEPISWVESLRDACVKASCIICVTIILWALSVLLLSMGI